MTVAQKSTSVSQSLVVNHSLVLLCGVVWLFLSVVIWSPRCFALVVLQYHHVSDVAPPSTSISPALFKAHMDFLDSHGFKVLAISALPALIEGAKKGKSLPDKSVIITFDDGYRSIYNTAWPILKKRQWPFTVFINSKPHDEQVPLYMSWAQLQAIAAGGATIGNHTDSHPHLIRRRDESHKQWQARRLQEILFAEKRIRQQLGKVEKVFAHPYGEYDTALLSMLKEQGYLAFGQQSGPVADYSHPQAIPRFPFAGEYGSLEDFRTKVYSMPFPALRVVVNDSRGRALTELELPSEEGMPKLQLISPIFRYAENGQCFATGQGEISVIYRGGSLVAQAKKPLNRGRSRYNCTAQAGGGRHFWYSQMFIRRGPGGQWYTE